MNLIKQIQLPHLDVFFKRYESAATVKAYTNDLRILAEYMERNSITGIETWNIPNGIEYRVYLAKIYSRGTVNRILSAAKAYTAFLTAIGYLDRNPFEAIELFRNTEYEPTPGLSDAEAAAILDASKGNPMHSAILHLMFYLGLRRSEVCALKCSDLGASMGIATLSVLGKGNKRRSLPIPEPVFRAIELYTRASIRESVDGPLFSAANSDGTKPLHHNSITKILHTYCVKAGVKKYSPHSARVTCVSNALDNGAQVNEVQALGGWTSLNMVVRYDRRRNELKNSAALKVNYQRSLK